MSAPHGDPAGRGQGGTLICALLLDRDDAAEFAGGEGSALGRPLCAYAFMAARGSAHVRRTYAMTGSAPVKAAALQYGAVIVAPPAGKVSAQEFLRHGYRQAAADLLQEGAAPELLVALCANAPAVTKDMIDTGVEALLDRPDLDSALSVARQERWSPALAQKQAEDGLLVPCSAAGAPAADDAPVWYPTWGVMVLRPRCIEDAGAQGPLPWLGRKVLPLKQWGVGPIDFHWQIPSLEFWLKKNGIPDLSSGLERQPLPQPRLLPKGNRR
jgi:hypothetical protein